MTIIPESIHAAAALLGEGPVWVERDKALWFVDIKSHHLHRLDVTSGTASRWDAPGEIGWVLPSDEGAFLSGLADGLYRFDPRAGTFTHLCEVEPSRPGNRLNDAAVDPSGRVWFGSMDNAEAVQTGHLFRFDRGMISDTGVAPVTITNGPAIAPDGQTLHAVDTLGRRIDSYTIDEDGSLRDKRCFVAFGDDVQGHPDGAICDSEGGVWVGFFGGWAARRYDAKGNLTHKVDFPVANITKIALGGADGRDAYATTARKGLDEAELNRQPLAGNIFHFRADVPGVTVTPVKME
ncbi:SMP-30/gluconolactonase/LRE family protein [Stakelama pacifica]|uniref:Sugar lactone lactonase YvrE n=1 Tax=Stakelama pacifica TaxID=517720 RepID=A0A4R6FY38_9SPHN|nr:SMP-30/gluconolactonase/LRE family protein [Stakelama pacifica]TDN86919.1 sugar lactone lactonase YvrE [Stakelama pacifica]GGO91066.1 gluconolaconase [Stakelama pacifica]